jgi:uncharacterized protein YxjI
MLTSSTSSGGVRKATDSVSLLNRPPHQGEKAVLHLRTFLVKERVAFVKLTDAYDIFDPENGHQVGVAQEEIPGLVKILKLVVNKKLMPTSVVVYEGMEQREVFRIRRGVGLLRTKVTVNDASGALLGYFKSKVFTLGGGFLVYDSDDQQFAEVKGDWKGWNFQVVTNDGQKIGTVTKKWAGIGKEFFTSADTYVIALEPEAPDDEPSKTLLLAAGLAIDTVFKEK